MVPHLDDAIDSPNESEENGQEAIPENFGTRRSARMRRQPARFRCLGVRQEERKRGTFYPPYRPSGSIPLATELRPGPSGPVLMPSSPQIGPLGQALRPSYPRVGPSGQVSR